MVALKRVSKKGMQKSTVKRKRMDSDSTEEVKKKKKELKEENGEEQDTKTTLADKSETVNQIKQQTVMAVTALRKFNKEVAKKSLFPEVDHGLYFNVVYKLPAMKNPGMLQKKILLPHSDRTLSNSTVCVIMPDIDVKGKPSHEVDKEANEWRDRIDAELGDSSFITKIVTLKQLKREYKSYHDIRALATAYDVFLAEASIHKSVRSHLGKDFHRAHKVPIPFQYDRGIKKAVEKALKTVILPLSALRTRTSLRVGHLAQSREDLVANVEEVLARVLEFAPGGLPNIRSVHLVPSTGKPSLPIYSDPSPSDNVSLPKVTQKKRRQRRKKAVEGELSTLSDGLKVAVNRDGKIRVIKEENGETVLYPTVKDEHEEYDDLKPTVDPEEVRKRKERKAVRVEKLKRKREAKKRASEENRGEEKAIRIQPLVSSKKNKKVKRQITDKTGPPGKKPKPEQ